MKYFKYLDLDWKPFAEKLRYYITDIRPEMSRIDPYDPSIWIDKEDLLKYASAELDNMMSGLDIQVETFRRRSNDNCIIIVCDVRFQNEAEYIIKKGL